MKYLILFLCVIIGLSIGNNVSKKDKFVPLLLVFSAGFLFTICIMDLFPVIYTQGAGNIGVWVIVGVFIQIVLEYFSKGIEHGHTHISMENQVPFGLVSGLLIHSFIEGMPLENHYENLEIKELWIAVALHKIPISILFATAIRGLALEDRLKYSFYMLFAFATPLGMYIGENLSESTMLILYAINAGIFLHISTLIIFESNKNHKFNFTKLGILVAGVVLAFII